MGELPNGPLAERHALWRDRMDGWKGERRTARALYKGGHWSIVRDLARREVDLQCFVISAGFGLVPIDAPLAPYAATFAFGQHDSIARNGGKDGPTENRLWWEQLCAWTPSGITGTRSICEAVSAARDGVHIFALSPFYLDAISEDLTRAKRELADPCKLAVISTGRKRHGELNENVISAPADLQTLLGGALSSLNVRVAAEIIRSIPARDLNLEEIRRFVRELAFRAYPRNYPQREHVTDAEVISYIGSAIEEMKKLKKNRKPSYTGLLHALRASGKACEMKRFRSLFRTTFSQ